MGNYNPSAPLIVGEEWPGIRDEDLVYSPAVNAVEEGHGFTLTTSRTLLDARFYLNTPSPQSFGQVMMAAVYPAGQEDLTGPIQRQIIPCSAGSVAAAATLANASTVAEALLTTGDNKSVVYTSPSGGQLLMSFPLNSYTGLAGKRILGVNLLYSAYIDYSFVPGTTESYIPRASLTNSTPTTVQFGNIPFAIDTGKSVFRLRFGEVAHFWLPGTSPLSTADRMPWTYTELRKFGSGAANALQVEIVVPSLSSGVANLIVAVDYAALEVVYCEERRVAVGGRSFGTGVVTGDTAYTIGANPITVRTLAYAANPVLAAGAYTLTLSSADTGDYRQCSTCAPAAQSVYPTLNAMREVAAIAPHPGVKVRIPFPPESQLGDPFTAETTHVLPHLSLHTSGGPLAEVHVYGRRAVAPVWGSVTATQDINDDKGTGTYPQARFWARRFGDTVQPLVLATVSPAGSTASITPADFDVLPEVLDGWRQVDLRFDVAPTITPTGGDASVRWSATGEDVGSRWEVLAVSAPALSGVPGNLLAEVASTHRLGPATYDPPAGATIALSYLSPPSSAAAEQAYTDAVVLLSQDPPTVTGFGIAALSQTVTAALDCGTPPRCVPTGIGYHRLTWAVTSMPVSGFGSYELQRFDTVDGEWQTVMLATSAAVTGFSDWEARIGVESQYRIRALNLYDFAGPWSATVSSTLAPPGVSGTRCTSGVLVFTSNSDQAGAYSLAHVMAWERGSPDEVFDFPEGSQTSLVEGFGRDFVTAFHGTERGGERFERVLLVNAAAISPERLADFTGLRDMAWADLPYVCVRDELGDRWLASVSVPQGRVRRNRRLYLATVRVVEVTGTPAPVDPASAP